ncbi:MAG TPA: DUF4198 domain-containing protein [Candidatus Binatia bacterium]|nr:DUF4198 domain-containing protein [Candidatus Binatia bacterium]
MNPRALFSASACLPGVIFVLAWAPAIKAHEFLIKPAQTQSKSGSPLSFSIMATHYFMWSEEVEPVDTVQAWLVEGEQITPLKLKENPARKTLDGTATLRRKGAALLTAHLQEPLATIKGERSNREQKIKREKFAKAFIAVGTNDDESDKKPLGHKLEIVPVVGLSKARAGEELSFRILLDGKPMRGPVYATYDGFSRRPMTFAYATESTENGIAYVKIAHPGLWMVRVEKRLEADGKNFDLLSLKATLVFSAQ